MMHFQNMAGLSTRSRVPQVAEKLTLKVRRRKDERDGSSERLLLIYRGDITEFAGDAIVNAANTNMLGGGGVDKAIHDAAGPRLREACGCYKPFRLTSTSSARCPTGDAKVTPFIAQGHIPYKALGCSKPVGHSIAGPLSTWGASGALLIYLKGFDLPAKWVIHTVGPIYDRMKTQQCEDDLHLSYVNSLALADNLGCKTIAFPAISCGVYRFPADDAAKIALDACMEFMGDIREAHFILFDNHVHGSFKEAAQACIDAEVVTLVQGDDPPDSETAALASESSHASAKATLDVPDASPMGTPDRDTPPSGKPTAEGLSVANLSPRVSSQSGTEGYSARKPPIPSDPHASNVMQEGQTSDVEKPLESEKLPLDLCSGTKTADISGSNPDALEPLPKNPSDMSCSSSGRNDNSRGIDEVAVEVAGTALESMAGEEATIVTTADVEAEAKALAMEEVGRREMQTEGSEGPAPQKRP